MWVWPIIVLQAYLFGSISSSVLLSRRLYNTDIRTRGSGNAGATNAARVFGMGMGLLTFGCDAAKTIAATGIGWWLGGEIGFALAGGVCLVGHCWPAFFKLKGGKGVTVGTVLSLLIDWRVFLVLAAVFFGLFAIARIVSVSSMGCAVALPILTFVFGCPAPVRWLGIFAGALVLWQHRSNFVRLLRGQESRFSPAKQTASAPSATPTAKDE